MAPYVTQKRDELEEILIEIIIRQQKEGYLCTVGFKDVDVSAIDNMDGLFCPDWYMGKYCIENIDWQDPRNEIGGWNVSGVRSMSGMFAQSHFNGDISKWNVSSVGNMASMFEQSHFDGNISQWDVSNVRIWKRCFPTRNSDRTSSPGCPGSTKSAI